MKVLVTGGAGFIGGNLCRRLIEEPGVEQVRVIDNLSTGRRDAIDGLGVEFVHESVLNPEALKHAAEGCDAIVHLAALGSVPRSVSEPLASHEANATGTLRVLEEARANRNAHVVLASSSSVYGANPASPKVETLECRPVSPYAVSKLATEQYAMAYAHCYGLPVLPFRFFNVFGPGQLPGHAYAAVIPAFLDAALSGRALPLNGDGEQSRDFTYVGTVVDTITRALTDRITSGPTNLAFGTRTTLNQLIGLIEHQLGKELQLRHRDPRPGDVRHSRADNSLLRELFPQVEPIALDQGLHETMRWMARHLRTVQVSDTRGASKGDFNE